MCKKKYISLIYFLIKLESNIFSNIVLYFNPKNKFLLSLNLQKLQICVNIYAIYKKRDKKIKDLSIEEEREIKKCVRIFV